MTNPGGILSDLFVHLSLVICHFRVWGLEAFETCALSVEWSNDFAVVVGIRGQNRVSLTGGKTSSFTTETQRARRFHRGIRVLRASPCTACLRGERERLNSS